MTRIGLVGFGRIGRSIFRINEENPRFDIVAINDINPETNNLAYLLQYDSTYGKFGQNVTSKDDFLHVNGKKVQVFHKHHIQDVPWKDLGVDIVIDASGIHDNVLAAPKLIQTGIKKVIVTHSPKEVDTTIVFGANEGSYDPAKHHIISSSICDAVSVSPVLNLIDKEFGLKFGFLTTLHPWLSYQNLLDGPSLSWALPGELYYHYAIGRSSVGSMIPKPTSAIEATTKVLPHLDGLMRSMSFRIPTPVVGIANLYLTLNKQTDKESVIELFRNAERSQKHKIIHSNDEPLVSIDFTGSPYSATVDNRWIEVAGKEHLYLVLWYDNEWGYSNRVLDVVELAAEKINN